MKKPTCCSMAASTPRSNSHEAADGKVHPPRVARRGFDWVKCSLPTLILALLPKCPACFAAYVALGTGISLSVAAAAIFRTLLIGVCVATLTWVLVSTLRAAMHREEGNLFAADLRR
jgi:hypothetical protein